MDHKNHKDVTLGGQKDLNLLEGVAHHGDQDVDEHNDDWHEVRSEHDLTNLLHVHTAVEF